MSASPAGFLRSAFTMALCLSRRNRTFVQVHNGDIGNRRNAFERLLWRAIRHRTERFVLLSPSLSNGLTFLEEDEKATVGNVLSRCFDEPIIERGLPARPTVLFLGNLIPDKGVFQAVELVREYWTGGAECDLLIAGASPTAGIRMRVEDSCGTWVWGSIRYLGPIEPGPAVRDVLCRSHLLLLPTSYEHEALPMVVLEALACGVPVIATPQGGIADAVTNGTSGFVLEKQDRDAWLNAMAAVLQAEAWSVFSKAARRDYDDRYSRSAVYGSWAALLDPV
jgi:glycosyltransferase involved in cell wall biosynthesis